jgi:hypothetical protein
MPDPTTTISTGKPDATEIGHVRFGKGSSEKDTNDGHLVGDLLHRPPGSEGGLKRTGSNTDTATQADSTTTIAKHPRRQAGRLSTPPFPGISQVKSNTT